MHIRAFAGGWQFTVPCLTGTEVPLTALAASLSILDISLLQFSPFGLAGHPKPSEARNWRHRLLRARPKAEATIELNQRLVFSLSVSSLFEKFGDRICFMV
jgi:hypothetical protein